MNTHHKKNPLGKINKEEEKKFRESYLKAQSAFMPLNKIFEEKASKKRQEANSAVVLMPAEGLIRHTLIIELHF